MLTRVDCIVNVKMASPTACMYVVRGARSCARVACGARMPPGAVGV